ncbi:MAG: hypothetical protein ABUT20_15450 [Bacteroidota bacterium]
MSQKTMAGKIAEALLRVQQSFGKLMNHFASRCSPLQLKIRLIVLCIGMTGFSIVVTWNSLKRGKLQPALPIMHLRIMKPAAANNISPVIVSTESYKRLLEFDHWLDSLRAHDRRSYDSINRVRPGLSDSIEILEKIYVSQQSGSHEK